MKRSVYEIVYAGLGVGSDLGALSLKCRVDADTLKAILHQRIVRETMHNHHKIKNQAHKLTSLWHAGESILQLSEKLKYPPVMTAWLILEQKNLNRRHFQAILRNPQAVKDPRLRRELSEAVKKDVVYSPQAISSQMERSRMVEETVRSWLAGKKIPYIDEKQAKENKQAKTPDFLLKKTLQHDGKTVHWVECKASFGDDAEINRDHRKQLRHYVDLYGSGMAVYWYGCIDDIKLKDIQITTGEFFR
jgi:hypothetical protein